MTPPTLPVLNFSFSQLIPEARLSQHWSYRAAFFTTLAAILVELIIMAVSWSSLPPAIPLWYSRPWGEEQLAHPLWLLVLPAGSVIVFIANTALASRFIPDHPVFGRILLLASLFVSVLSLLAIVNIVLLVL
jgi:hypothetical protein